MKYDSWFTVTNLSFKKKALLTPSGKETSMKGKIPTICKQSDVYMFSPLPILSISEWILLVLVIGGRDYIIP